MKLSKSRITKGGQLVVELHPDMQLPECISEDNATKIRCIAESVYSMTLSDLSERERLNYVKCAITSAFMLGKNDAYDNLGE
jgi:hypothetical protein